MSLAKTRRTCLHCYLTLLKRILTLMVTLVAIRQGGSVYILTITPPSRQIRSLAAHLDVIARTIFRALRVAEFMQS